MFQRILVPLDGSEGSELAIPLAARIARGSKGTIVFIRVVPPPPELGAYAPTKNESKALPPSTFEKDMADAVDYLTATTSVYAKDLEDIATEMDLAAGAASPQIFSTAHLEHVDLIVMCSHGETGLKRWVLGSVAQQAVRHSPVPILVLNEHGMVSLASEPGVLRVLVPLDSSALSESAVEPAAQLLVAWTTPQVQGELHLLRVVDLPSAYGRMKSQAYITDSMQVHAKQEAETYVKALADRLVTGLLAGTTLTVTTSVVTNTDVAGTIIKLAEQARGAENAHGYSMIAMATHGRSGLQRLVLGSVTEHVLGATKLPLLIVRPSPMREEAGKTTTVEVTEIETQSWVGLL